MKKKTIFTIFCFCFIMFNLLMANADVSEEKPTIKICGYSEKAYVGDVYNIYFDVKPLYPVNDCVIILHYNPNVLKRAEQYDIDDGLCDYYAHTLFYGEESIEGQYKFRVYYSGDCNGTHIHESLLYSASGFKVIGKGDPEFRVEIVKDDCKDGANIQVDISGLVTETIEDPSEINVSYNDGVLVYTGYGRVKKTLEEYDIEKVIPTDKNDIEQIKFDDGITDIYYSAFVKSKNLKDIWIPDSVKYLDVPGYMKDVVVLHANGMTYAEEYASKYDYQFKLNEGFKVGDLDSNGAHNADDALNVLKMAAKIGTLYKWSADIDSNGNVDAKDALEILKIAAKIQ